MADLDACNELADSMYAQKERYKSLSKDQKEALALSDSLNKSQASQIKDQAVLVESYKKGEKKNKIKSKFLKGFATGFGIIALVETAYIGLQQLFKQ